MPRAVIASLATHVPAGVLDNAALAARLGHWTEEEIFAKTGIRERHVAAPEECASDLAFAAARQLIDSGRLHPSAVDAVLFCTQAPDFLLPTTACLLQDRLGLRRDVVALDYNLGCSGYVVGLALAKGLIESGLARTVLLLTADTYSKFIHPLDRSVCTLFGDGAAATVLTASDHAEAGLGAFVFGTDGRGGDQLIVPTGGARRPRTPESAVPAADADGNWRAEDNLRMNGREIFRFAITTVPKAVADLLAKSGYTPETTDYLVLHQANRYMNEELIRKLRWPPEKAPLRLETLGNTVSSTIPFVLEELLATGRLTSGRRLLLVGFGVGYSWAGCALTWA
jgi:3-oxoacyl-[acyl-carrier-protein] synthase-3